ncbi:MAG: ATP-binding cassette domain-containing protein [Bdellovibrionales bacterium]|nr:ATP-binding cassette domain-containing protein [Bdellovibrionales bacterium]
MMRLERLRGRIGRLELEADFSVSPGERLALVGPSGCGKTTVLRWIAGLRRPEEGRIFLGEEELTKLRPEERGVGVVFQDQALLPHLNVLENTVLGLALRGMPRFERNARGVEYLARAGLAGREADSVERLSGGERQRVALARALVWKPRVLLLDEPFTGLDAGLKADQAHWILELHRLTPVPLIVVTHDPAEVALMATRRIEVLRGPGERSRFTDGRPSKG